MTLPKQRAKEIAATLRVLADKSHDPYVEISDAVGPLRRSP